MVTALNRWGIPTLFALSLLTSGVLQSAEYKVGMRDWLFTPEELTIKAGDSVTWLNDDSADHNLAFYGARPAGAPTKKKPQDMRVGEEYTLVFDQTGIFEYVCKIHRRQDMKGVIIVK